MAEILLSLIVAMVGVNLTATFKLLYEVGGLKETIKSARASIERLQSRVSQLEKKGANNEMA